MNHKGFLQWAIVAVVATLIVWSVVNVATYAYFYHRNAIVATLGIAVGAANAISVYAFVIATTGRVRWPAGVGILLFGGASGTLQMLLYLHDGAPLAAAISFGWIGPVAEGVLSWLHAALSDMAVAEVPQRGSLRDKRTVATPKVEAPAIAEPAVPLSLPSTVLEAYNMQRNGMKLAEIATQLRKSERTVSNYLQQAKAQMNHKETA